MSGITCKFGGTSLADAACVIQVERIINANPDRRFIVPSAPGKRNPKDRKITDLLYAWHNLALEGLDPAEPQRIIAERFNKLADDLGVDFDTQAILDDIDSQLSGLADDPKKHMHAKPDFMASRGEYINGRLIAAYFNATFLDPADYIKFTKGGRLDPASYDLLAEKLQGDGLFVVPGFYGSLPDGRIKTFSRGGSDVTGSIVARASRSSVYENWTDVSGFRMTDPRVVPHAKRIEEITYKELRELSYMGASVLHDEAIFPVLDMDIPIQIRNTWEPNSPGTLIVGKRESEYPVCGIAGQGGFSMINIEKTLMNKERGFGFKVLQVLEENGVSWEHMPTGIDTISIIIKDEELDGQGEELLDAIKARCNPDYIDLESGYAMIATVGQGMNNHVGVAGRLCTALAEAEVNLEVIDQGSSEMNIILGVYEEDLPKALEVIYNAFHDWK